MRFLWLRALVCLSCVLFSACPNPSNPGVAWLGPGDSEALVKLVDKEPNPF